MKASDEQVETSLKSPSLDSSVQVRAWVGSSDQIDELVSVEESSDEAEAAEA